MTNPTQGHGVAQLYILGEKKNAQMHLQMSVEGWCEPLRARAGMISHILY